MSLLDDTITTESVLNAALGALFDNDEEMSWRSLARKVAQKLGRPELDEAERTQLEQVLRREGATLVRPPVSNNKGWSLTVQGRTYLYADCDCS